MPPLKQEPDICGFQFGEVQLWLDRVATVSQAELWLQVDTPAVTVAKEYLEQEEVVRCDEIEPLPDLIKWEIDSEMAQAMITTALATVTKPFSG